MRSPGRVRLFGIAANYQVGLAVNQQRQPLADDGMIVDDQNPAGLWTRRRLRTSLHRNPPLSWAAPETSN